MRRLEHARMAQARRIHPVAAHLIALLVDDEVGQADLQKVFRRRNPRRPRPDNAHPRRAADVHTLHSPKLLRHHNVSRRPPQSSVEYNSL